MNVRLTLNESDAEKLQELREWLLNESELRGQIKTPSAQPDSNQMGVLGDALIVAVGSGGALSVLFASLKAWFAQPKRSDVRIEVRTEDGRQIILSAARVSRPEEIVREVLGNDGLD
jgi:hypothetical protein